MMRDGTSRNRECMRRPLLRHIKASRQDRPWIDIRGAEGFGCVAMCRQEAPFVKGVQPYAIENGSGRSIETRVFECEF